MKRICLAILLVLSLFSCSGMAESSSQMLLWDISADSSFQYEQAWYDPFADTLSEMQRIQTDAAVLRLYNDDLQPFIEADFLADLSASPAIAQAVSRMPEWLQQLVTTDDGQILALPTSAIVRPFYWYPDAWEGAGLSAEDVPQSFEELLDFLDAWSKNKPHKNVCVSRLVRWDIGEERLAYVHWLMKTLLKSHIAQQYHAGETLSFQTPVFIELAEHARKTGITLYETEPGQQKRQNMLQLFQNDISGGEHANGGRPYGLSHSIPLRLTADQPALTGCSVEVAFVRKGSPWLEEGIRLLETRLEKINWWNQYALYMDFQAGDYAYDSSRTGRVDEGWLKDYRSYEGSFVTAPSPFAHVREGLDRKDALLMQFCRGEISAEVFAEQLDELLEAAF